MEVDEASEASDVIAVCDSGETCDLSYKEDFVTFMTIGMFFFCIFKVCHACNFSDFCHVCHV